MDKATAEPTPEQTPEFNPKDGIHEPYSWYCEDKEDFPLANLAALTMDVCAGINTCLELIHSCDLSLETNAWADAGDEVQPILSVQDRSRLMRLAISASAMLRTEGEHGIDWINNHSKEYLKNQAEKNS